ncbi:MAG TPA: four helix bundle protein [Draconibacterium sp.]|nr:four helix bundle protein [Draconibacterium sp.]
MGNHPYSGHFDFESLELYKKSLGYVDFVYTLIQKFPSNERFELTSQFKRASNSITLNVAEGYGESIPLSLKYLKIVRGSVRECLACTTIAYRRKFIDEQIYTESREKLTELSKLTAGYGKYLKNKLDK